MRSVSIDFRRLWVVAALIAVVSAAVPTVHADEGNPGDPPSARILPPIGVTSSGRIGPPIGVSAANRIGPPIGAPSSEARILAPLPIQAERMTLADQFWAWLLSRVRPPLP